MSSRSVLRMVAPRHRRLIGILLVLQLLHLADLGTVVSRNDRPLDESEMLATATDLRRRVRSREHVENALLLRLTQPREGLAMIRQAVAVEPVQSLHVLLACLQRAAAQQKIRKFRAFNIFTRARGVGTQQKIDKPLNLGGSCAGSICGRNEEVSDRHHRLGLVVVEELRLPVRSTEARVRRLGGAEGHTKSTG